MNSEGISNLVAQEGQIIYKGIEMVLLGPIMVCPILFDSSGISRKKHFSR
jgi:hypothetical protein